MNARFYTWSFIFAWSSIVFCVHSLLELASSASYSPCQVTLVIMSVHCLLSRVLTIISETAIPLVLVSNYSDSILLVFLCLFFLPTFPLLRHIPNFSFLQRARKNVDCHFLFRVISSFYELGLCQDIFITPFSCR